jgi:Transposase DDE domain
VSEPAEVQEALLTVSQALTPLKEHKTITWLLDSGFDDGAVWRTIWEAQEHLVCRVSHLERLVSFQDRAGQWQEGNLAQALGQLRKLARVQTTLVVKRGKQARAKKQLVEVEIAACPMCVTYATNVRRQGTGHQITREVWVVEVHIVGSDQDSWLLLTDWPVTDAPSAARIFTRYRQRWGVEDSFKFLKTCLGWEEVQVLDWQALRTLVALGWVAAGFLYGLSFSWDWAEVQLLSKLGGWEPHTDRQPGKITLQRGLSRLLDMLVTQAILAEYETIHHSLPPQIEAFLPKWGPPRQL